MIFGHLVRSRDAWGDGHFGASRDGGGRKHEGIDLAVWPGTPIFTPTGCKVVRRAMPYADDTRFEGVLLRIAEGVELKMLYVLPDPGVIGLDVAAGTLIGRAQDLREKYVGITPHVHVELWVGGVRVNPAQFLGVS